MSDANSTSLAFAEETTLGTPTDTDLKFIRFTKESLGFQKETVASQEIRDDRQVPDSAKVFGQPGGGFEFELSFGFILPFIAAALQNDWITGTKTVSTAINHSASTLTAAAGTFTGLPIGAILMISGATTPANNGPKRVAGVNPDGSICQCVAGSFTVTETMSLTSRWKTISNGTTRKSFTLEKKILNSEGADYFQRYRGMVLDTLDLTVESKKIIMGSANFVGTTYDVSDTGLDEDALTNVTATGTLTFTANPTAGDTCTIGGQVYSFVASLSSGGTANQILIGAAATNTLDNLIAAINVAAGEGTLYGLDTVKNTYVTAAAGAGDTMTLTSITQGAAGNAVGTTETFTAAGNVFAAATLTGGVTQTAGYAAAETSSIMNGTNNVGTVKIDGAEATDRFKMFKVTLSNNVRGKDAIGFEGNWDIGLGQFNGKGNLNAYFRNNTLPTKILNHTSFSVDFSVTDAEGNKLFFYFPILKPSGGDPKIEGINTDVMIDTGFDAILGSAAANASRKMCIIDAIAAA